MEIKNGERLLFFSRIRYITYRNCIFAEEFLAWEDLEHREYAE